MAWFKSDAWEEVLETADLWREEAASFVNDPIEYPSRLGVLTYKMMELCAAHTPVDPSLLWDMWRQIEVQSGKSTMGTRVSRDRLRGMMMHCVGVLERLKHLGITDTKPATRPDSKTDNEKKSLPDSPDVRDLCRLSQNGLPQGKTQLEIALDFTGNNDDKAQSLLRQARRFRHLWQ